LNSSETEARIEAVKYLGILRRKPILVGTLLIQQWPATRDHAGVASLAEARRQRPNPRWPVLELATRRRSLRCRWQRPPAAEPAAVFGAVAAAARAALDACELQDDREGQSADRRACPHPPSPTASAPPPAEPRKKTRGSRAPCRPHCRFSYPVATPSSTCSQESGGTRRRRSPARKRPPAMGRKRVPLILANVAFAI
jgi:hypothetical protein